LDASDPDVTKFICISGSVQITSVDTGVTGTITCRGNMCSVHLGELGASVVNPQAWWARGDAAR
jgi:hypothetical protein